MRGRDSRLGGEDVRLEELDRGDGAHLSFRFRYLLPLAIEVQYLSE